MKVSYFHVAGEVPDTINGPDGPDAAVVIDVLRATTTIAWALHNGAEAVQTFADLDELRAEANAWPDENVCWWASGEVANSMALILAILLCRLFPRP
jgi:hypothetical protein